MADVPTIPWMKLWVADLMTSADWLSMTSQERGWFTCLIGSQWLLKGRGLPDEPISLYRYALCDVSPDDPAWESFCDNYLTRLFPRDSTGKRYNKRCQQEWEKALPAQMGRSKGGQESQRVQRLSRTA